MVVEGVQGRGWTAVVVVSLVAGLSSFAAERASAQAASTLSPLGSSPFGSPSLTSPYPSPAENTPTPNYQYETNIPPSLGIQPGPGFQIAPRITLGEEYNDNIFQSESDRRWDLITLIAPGIAVADDSNRIKFNLNYSPVFRIYARNSSQNSVGQQALGFGTAELVQDTFFVNARVFASLAPTNGGFTNVGLGLPQITNTGFNGGAGASLSKSNLSQVTSSGVTPYLVHQFGDFGTGKIGLNLTESSSSQTSNGSIGGSAGPGEQTFTGEAIGQFTSGSDWGRFLNVTTIDASKTTGTGVSGDSEFSIFDNKIGYALRQSVIVFGEFGAESIQYNNTTPHISISDGVWGVGTTLLPNDQSQITVEYGHRNGVTGFQASMNYAVTARTTLTASYSTGLTTDLQDIQAQLEAAGVSPLGNAIALNTSAPVSLVNALGGVTNQLYRGHQLNAGVITAFDRDSLSLNVTHSNEEAIAAFQSQQLFNNISTSVTGQWMHELTMRASLTTTLSYGARNTNNDQNETFYSAGTQLQYFFTDKLIGTAAYSFLDRKSNVPGVPMYDNLVLLTITRTF